MILLFNHRFKGFRFVRMEQTQTTKHSLHTSMKGMFRIFFKQIDGKISNLNVALRFDYIAKLVSFTTVIRLMNRQVFSLFILIVCLFQKKQVSIQSSHFQLIMFFPPVFFRPCIYSTRTKSYFSYSKERFFSAVRILP